MEKAICLKKVVEMMLSLKDKEWDEFYIVDYFTPQRGREGNMTGLSLGNVPLISAKKTSNGLKAFVSVPSERLHLGHVITLNNDGDGGAGLAYYQPFSSALDTHVTALRPVSPLSKYALIFISSAISKQGEKFGHGHAISNSRLKKMKMLLPINEVGKPDFPYMEEYIRKQEQLRITEYSTYANKVLADVGEVKDVLPLKDKKWRAFRIEDIAKVEPGRDIYDAERKPGHTPYISSTSINNGIAHYVSNDNSTKEESCISVNRNGSVGYAFYHPYKALYSNDCRKLRLNQPLKYVSIFIANQITSQRDKYSYGYKMGTARLKRQSILLPVNERNELDWAYMEQYTKFILRQQLKTYLSQKDIRK